VIVNSLRSPIEFNSGPRLLIRDLHFKRLRVWLDEAYQPFGFIFQGTLIGLGQRTRGNELAFPELEEGLSTMGLRPRPEDVAQDQALERLLAQSEPPPKPGDRACVILQPGVSPPVRGRSGPHHPNTKRRERATSPAKPAREPPALLTTGVACPDLHFVVPSAWMTW